MSNTIVPQSDAALLADIENWIDWRCNILIAGENFDAKVPLVQHLVSLADQDDRLLILEHGETLNIERPHSLVWQINEDHDMGDFIRYGLKTHPDRIIVDELGDEEECLNWIGIISTGHSGSIVTTNAQSAQDTVARLYKMTTTGTIDYMVPSDHALRWLITPLDLIVTVGEGMNEPVIVHVTQTQIEDGDVYFHSLWEQNKITQQLEHVGEYSSALVSN